MVVLTNEYYQKKLVDYILTDKLTRSWKHGLKRTSKGKTCDVRKESQSNGKINVKVNFMCQLGYAMLASCLVKH